MNNTVSVQGGKPDFRIQPDKNKASVCYFLLDGVSASGSGSIKSAQEARDAFCPVAEVLFSRMEKIAEFAYAVHQNTPFIRISLTPDNIWAHGGEGTSGLSSVRPNEGKVVSSTSINRGAAASNSVSSNLVNMILKNHINAPKGLIDRAFYLEQHDEKSVREILKKAIEESPVQKRAKGHEGSIVFKDWEKSTKTLVYSMSGACDSNCTDGDTTFTEAMLARYMQSSHGKYVSTLRREP